MLEIKRSLFLPRQLQEQHQGNESSFSLSRNDLSDHGWQIMGHAFSGVIKIRFDPWTLPLKSFIQAENDSASSRDRNRTSNRVKTQTSNKYGQSTDRHWAQRPPSGFCSWLDPKQWTASLKQIEIWTGNAGNPLYGKSTRVLSSVMSGHVPENWREVNRSQLIPTRSRKLWYRKTRSTMKPAIE